MTTPNEKPQGKGEEYAQPDLPQDATLDSILGKYWDDNSGKPVVSDDGIVDADGADGTEDDVGADDKPAEIKSEGIATSRDSAVDEEQQVSLLDDDEAWLKGDDMVLSEDDDAAFIKQVDHTVSWHIEGLYSDRGKTFNQLYLRENPPLLIVESSTGETASFVLSKEMTRTLSTGLNDLKKAYYGAGRARGETRTLDEKMRGIPQWGKENPIKAVITALLIAMMIALLIIL